MTTGMAQTLASTAGPPEHLDIELHIDRARRIVRLDMLEFDADLVVAFLKDRVIRGHGVQVDGIEPDRPFQLVITLSGRHHPARLNVHSDGRYSLRLLDPDASYLVQCQLAIAHLLAALHEREIEAFITGIDPRGRPEPDDGFLHLYARTSSEEQVRQVEEVRKHTQTKFNVSVCVLGPTNAWGPLDLVRSAEAHFEWDPSTRQVVRRGPGWSTWNRDNERN